MQHETSQTGGGSTANRATFSPHREHRIRAATAPRLTAPSSVTAPRSETTLLCVQFFERLSDPEQ